MDREHDFQKTSLDYEPSYLDSYSFRDQYAPMSIGHWVFVLVLTAIPGVNLLFLFFWAFFSSVNKNLRNYSRALLIIFLVVSVLSGVGFGIVRVMKLHIPFIG